MQPQRKSPLPLNLFESNGETEAECSVLSFVKKKAADLFDILLKIKQLQLMNCSAIAQLFNMLYGTKISPLIN